MRLVWSGIAAAALAVSAMSANAQLSSPSLSYIGTIKARSSNERKAAGLTSPFGIGGETTDRGFSNFDNWKDYLGPLGATRVRVQSGWNAIETVITETPTYNFSTLDAIVDGALARGVQPWVFLGYGNTRPGCVDCGTPTLGGQIPTGAGMERWLKFVKATVARYNSPTVRVNDWELWNEPDGHVEINAYIDFIARTAQAVKEVQPSAKITIGSFTTGVTGGANSPSFQYAQQAVAGFAARAVVPPQDVCVSFHTSSGWAGVLAHEPHLDHHGQQCREQPRDHQQRAGGQLPGRDRGPGHRPVLNPSTFRRLA